MDHRYIEDNNLIERYVLGTLPVEDQVRFEEHFAECEACVAELELADDFGTALRVATADDVQRVAQASFVNVLAYWLRGPRMALVLGALVAAMAMPAFWLVSENQRLSNDLASLRQPQANVPSFLLTLARDAEAPTQVFTVPLDEPWLTLAIEADNDDIVSYDAILSDAAGRIRWQQEGLEINLWSVLQLTFPTASLPAGDYQLELVSHDAGGRSEPAGTYSFQIASP